MMTSRHIGETPSLLAPRTERNHPLGIDIEDREGAFYRCLEDTAYQNFQDKLAFPLAARVFWRNNMKILFASATLAMAIVSAPANAQTASPAPATSDAAQVAVAKVLETNQTSMGQPIVLPRGDVHVVVTTFDIPAGAKLPPHKHPWPRYAYVLSGQLTVETADHKRKFAFKAGDFIVEMTNLWHFGSNTGSEPVRLLVIDQVQGNMSNTMLMH
jgi:quercetin dioxygenase-like cupin family protein